MVTARTALLLVLREGPGYGRDLVRRIRQASAGRLRFAEGSIPGAAAPRGRSARAELGRRARPPARRTGPDLLRADRAGARASEADRVALLRLAVPTSPPLPGPDDSRRMLERIELGAELSETAG